MQTARPGKLSDWCRLERRTLFPGKCPADSALKGLGVSRESRTVPAQGTKMLSEALFRATLFFEGKNFSSRSGERLYRGSWRRPYLRSADADRGECSPRCDLRRSPITGRVLRVRPLLLPPSEGTRILPCRFAASRNFLVFFIPGSVVEPSRAATRHAAFCATLRGFTDCFPRAPQCLSAPRRALTTMGLNAVNRDPSISSSYHRSAPAAGRLVSGSTRGDHK